MHRSYQPMRRKCAVSGCCGFARCWVKLTERKFIAICTNCKRAMPADLIKIK